MAEALVKALRGLTVDVIGPTLVGFLFLSSMAVSILFPIIAVIHAAAGTATFMDPLLNRTIDMPAIIALGTLSFLMGHLFWEMDPNLPDSYSFNRLPEPEQKYSPGYIKPNERADLERRHETDLEAEREKRYTKNLDAQWYAWIHTVLKKTSRHLRAKFGAVGRWVGRFLGWLALQLPWRDGFFVEYPYARLREFLERRGLKHLSVLVPWSIDEMNLELCSQHRINAIKTRIALACPDQYARIAHNEGMVRVSCAFWYCLRPVWLAAMVGIILGIIAHIIGWTNGSILEPERTTVTLLAVAAFFGICYIEKAVLNSLHDMRIREIVQILETAHYLDQRYPEKQILTDLTAGGEKMPP